MTTAAEHYDDLLAEHYTWMLGGDIEALASAQADLLRGLGVTARPGDGSAAVDLGWALARRPWPWSASASPRSPRSTAAPGSSTN